VGSSSRAIGPALAIGFVLAAVLSSCALLPCVERAHDSGVLLVCAEPIRDMPESLKAASSFAYELASQHPDEFGYPWADPDTGELVLRVTGAAADPFVRAWTTGTATRGTGDKTLPLPRPEVAVKLVTVDRSFRQLEAIKDGAVPPRGLPDGDLIWQTAPDARRNAVAISIDHLSDALVRALAAKYGTAAIVIRVERNPHIGY
jgi:hypothetical protein